MNTLDVCCALIELPAARGPLLLGAKKKTGQSNGLLYEFPGGSGTRGECPARRHTGNTGRAGMHRLPRPHAHPRTAPGA